MSSSNQSCTQAQGNAEPESSERVAPQSAAEASIDVFALHSVFAQMQDTHEFFGLLQRFGLRRTAALHLLGQEAAQPVDRLALRPLFCTASESAMRIMVFVGNSGMIQIHSGPVKTIQQYGSWFNIMDPGFNLHVHEPTISRALVVRKPTREGIVSSLELYDAAGVSILFAFSKREHGQSESGDWRSLLRQLPDGVSAVNPFAVTPQAGAA